MDPVDKYLQIDDSQIKEIERATCQQAKSERWLRERRHRMTASRFGEFCKASGCPAFGCQRDISHIPAVAHGKKYESVALKKYESLHSVKVLPAGFSSAKNILIWMPRPMA
jgi:hypothetical protein